jgi:hypothetical protein
MDLSSERNWQAACLILIRMIRVTVVEATPESAQVRVEGRLKGPWVAELQRSCEVNGLSDGIELNLDVGDLTFVDAAGIELLRSLRGRGVKLLRVPALVAGQLCEPPEGRTRDE